MPGYPDPDHTRQKNSATIPVTFPLSERRSGWSASCPPARSSHKLAVSLLAAKNDPVTKTKQSSPPRSVVDTSTPSSHSFPKTDSHFLSRKLSPRACPSIKAMRAEWPPFRCETPKLPLRLLRKDAKPEELLHPAPRHPEGQRFAGGRSNGLRGQTAERSCCHVQQCGKVATSGS
jgi:hypothetical protein